MPDYLKPKPNGCDWLKDYLATHPEAREQLRVCQE